MAGIKFFIRQRTKTRNDNTSIYVRFWCSGGFQEITKTEYSIEPTNWSVKKQKASLKADNREKDWLNNELVELGRFILNEHQQHTNKYNLEKKWLKSVVEKFHNPDKFVIETKLSSFITKYMKSCKGTKSDLTIKSYSSSLKRLEEFEKQWDRDLSFANIDLDFHRSFLEYCAVEKNMVPTTIGKHIKNVKLFMSEAEEEGLKVNQSYKSKRFVKPYSEAQTIYLTDDEIKKIFKLDLSSNPTLDKTRDLFIIGCATGLRFSDYSNIKRENIKTDESGLILMDITPIKTGKKIAIPIDLMASQTLKKYNFELPKAISNQNFNLQIKDIGKLAKIEEELPTVKKVGKLRTDTTTPKYNLITSHTARRSFATNCHLAGISSIEIMQMTGHRTESAFLKYIKITQEQTALKLAKHPRFAHNNNLKII